MQTSSFSVAATPLVPGQLWTLHTAGNRFLSLVEIYNNALLVKTAAGLVVVNPPSSASGYIDAVRTLSQAEQAPVCALFSPGDWHHRYLVTWASAFPEAPTYVASPRVLKKQPALQGRVTVLSQQSPTIPELEPDCMLIPWLGSKQPPWIVGGDKPGSARVEHLLLHNATQTLFVTDHVLAPGVIGSSITPNVAGFSRQRGGAEALRASAQRVLNTRPRRIVFSHGHQAAFIMGDGRSTAEAGIRDKLANAYRFFGL